MTSLRHLVRYRHAFRAWIGLNDTGYVTMLVSGPVA
jgi:hypothetical protein